MTVVGASNVVGGGTVSGPATVVGPSDTAGGWWLFKFRNGAVGLQRLAAGAATPANVTGEQLIAPHNVSLLGLSSTPRYIGVLTTALGRMASPKQAAALIAQLDAGAGKASSTHWLYVGSDKAGNGVSANTSTALTGDATPINQIPSPIPPSVGNSHLGVNVGGLAIRVLEAVGAILLLVLGLRALMGGPSVTEVAGKVGKAALL